MIKLKSIKEKLYEIERIEGDAHSLWDEACMNSDLTEETQRLHYEKTLKATALHSKSMELIRGLRKEIQSLIEKESILMQN